MALNGEKSPSPTRSVDPAGRTLATTIRDHLLAGDLEPLPPSVQARLSASSDAERMRVVSAVVVGFGEAVRVLVRDELIEPEPEERLLRVVIGCGIRTGDFEIDGALTRLARAAARRELHRGGLPAWHVATRGLVETGTLAVWFFPDVQVHEGELVDGASGWTQADGAAATLSEAADLSGFKPVGRGRLVVKSEGLRLDSPECWLHLSLRAVQGLEFRRDGVILNADARRLALIEGDGWFLGELLRLVHETGKRLASDPG